jgi:hypothetical protein
MSDFEGRPLAIGEVYGVRQWTVDSLGRLCGLSYPQIWTPGENQAECKRTRQTVACIKDECGVNHEFSSAPGGYLIGRAFTMGVSQCVEPDPCDLVNPDCKCGFWAYYAKPTGEYGWLSTPTVTGVIRGYGKTTIGTKGFRCEKAEVLAMKISRDLLTERREMVLHNYPDVLTYSKVRAMMNDFPLPKPSVPTPETDPTFWTRPSTQPVDPPKDV